MQAETLKWIKSYKSPNFILGTCYLYADKKKKKNNSCDHNYLSYESDIKTVI